MGVANGAARAEPPAGGFLTTVVRRGTRGGARIDLVVLCALSGLLIGLAAARRDFLGDGVRHLPAVLATHPKFGEPRWLLFPAIAWTWVRALSGVGVVTGADSAIQALLWMCVASGIAYLHAIRSWLVLECGDASRRAAALLLAGSCAPVLILFSDIAEPQIAAAVVICGLLYARRHRDDLNRANQGALVAIVAIAIATLMYQGAILALGMLPLVAYPPSLGKWRLAATAGAAVFLVFVVMIGAQVAAGTTVRLATTTAVAGERNPLTRSLMGRPSAAKYVAAIVAGPPQGVVALENFSGIPSLVTALRGEDAQAAQRGILNASRLLLGCVVVAILVAVGIRTASWRLLIALAVLLVLPVLRNQQDRLPEVLRPLADSCRASRRSMSHADDRTGGGRRLDIERVDRGTRRPPRPRAVHSRAGGLRTRDSHDLLVYQRMVPARFLLVAGNHGSPPRRAGDGERSSRSGIGADGCNPPVLLRVRRCLDRHVIARRRQCDIARASFCLHRHRPRVRPRGPGRAPQLYLADGGACLPDRRSTANLLLGVRRPLATSPRRVVVVSNKQHYVCRS